MTAAGKPDRIAAHQMAEKLDMCCQSALDEWLARIRETVVSYPVIQERPCPTCRKIVKIRVYNPPEAELQ